MTIDHEQMIQRDGASQASRQPPALDPAALPIDQRSIADLLRFARKYASELRYINEQNQADGDWSAFLDGDLDAMARYLSDAAQRQPTDAAPSARPHVVLLLIFLELLQTAQTQLNDLTRRHLEFYYREALGLTAKPSTPDRVHVLVDLAAGQEQLLLPAGTLLTAGQDSQGVDLHYRTDQEIFANRARVASLRSLFLQRQLIGIREARQNPDLVAAMFPQDSPWQALERDKRAFMAMLALALGTADPGGALPPYPAANQPNQPVDAALADLDRLVAFIQSDLAMPLPVFRTLMELKQQQDSADQAWKQVNAILDSAGKRRTAGFQLDTSAPRNFEQNLLAALGLRDFSTFFNTLPEVADVYDLYRLRERAEVRDFIEKDNQLYMSFSDFVSMIGIIDDIYKDWRRIYDILRTAARRKTPKQPLAPPNLRAYDPNKFETLAGQTLGQLTFPAIVGQPGGLDACYDQMLKLEAYFHMPIEDFAAIRDINAKGPAAKPWEWEQAYTLLDQAYAAKALPRRWDQLRTAHHDHGFDAMIRLALGDPAPGDSLPDTRNFLNLNPALDQQYIREQLYLEIANFTYIQYAQQGSTPIDDPTWDTVYKILELAERRKRGWQAPRAQIERVENIYAAADATRVQAQLGQGDTVVTPRWRTFGAGPAQPDQSVVVPAAAGFALASPLLALAEGDRTITLTLTFAPTHFDLAAIQTLLKASPPLPLRFFLSAPDGMVELLPAETNKPATIVIEAESVPAPTASGVLRVSLHLPAQAPPVAPLALGEGINTPWPILQIQLPDIADKHDLYRAFQPLALQRVDLKVAVVGLTQLTLQNDDGVLDAKKPFEPFGVVPVAGSSFAIAHPELCSKQLDSLTMQIDWLGAPDNFHEYYQGYTGYQIPQPNPASPIADNTAFQGQLRLYDNRTFFDIQPIQLFHADAGTPATGATKPNMIAVDGSVIKQKQNDYRQDPQPFMADEVLSWSRYWQLELLVPDFQHAIYPRAAAGYANRRDASGPNPFIVNPPYTPKIKRLALGYSASESIDLLADAVAAGRLYQIEPFGYRELAREDDSNYYFLPQYLNEGELYSGIAGLTPPQQLALLFQLAEGSADPDVAREPVQWSYLDGDRWSSLEHGRMLSDTTNGLLNSGIITFDLPPAAPSTWLPSALYWLRVAIAKNSRSVADMVAIEAQALSATFADQGNAPDHLSQPLPPNSITGLVEPQPEVQAIRQPYSSIGGKAPEQAGHFYTRVSERLRHKNRALTSWDYERMILEAFPAIYKVKCLPAGTADDPRLADQIQIIVIPNIRGKLPFDPFEPKVAGDTLAQIAQYLSRHTSPAARFVIVNPTYIRLQVRLGVRLRPGYNPGYYLQALDQELQRFLAPWAYDQSAEIVFGGKINASLIVNFAEERPYVDYVAGIKLFIRLDERSNAQQVAPEFIVPPDAILVSDRQHQIDLISEEVYQEAYFTGIGSMQIELDFQVAR